MFEPRTELRDAVAKSGVSVFIERDRRHSEAEQRARRGRAADSVIGLILFHPPIC
jgi:hypothetical protein